MTKEMKFKVEELRAKGLSYSEISKETGVKSDALRAYFSRKRKKTVDTKQDDNASNVCKCCGKLLNNIPGKAKKTYCSNACRQCMAYYKRKTQTLSIKHTCPTCGKIFTVLPSSKQKYCSRKCVIKALYY